MKPPPNILQTLSEQLAVLEQELHETERQLDDRKDKRSKIEQKISVITELQQQTAGLLAEAGTEVATRFPALQLMRNEAFGDQSLTVESCDNREREMRDWLQVKIDSEDRKLSRLGEKIIRAMTEYKEEWKLETREVDVNIAAGKEYRSMFEQLRADDLPRFEGRFKDLLNENTIREVANFQSQLARERETIKERVIHYWGDIDTHGFAILNQLRGFFPHAASLLMDRETLMEHQALWGVEPSPETGALMRLTGDENALYDQLRRDELGSHVRLEQERIGFEWLVDALGRV